MTLSSLELVFGDSDNQGKTDRAGAKRMACLNIDNFTASADVVPARIVG